MILCLITGQSIPGQGDHEWKLWAKAKVSSPTSHSCCFLRYLSNLESQAATQGPLQSQTAPWAEKAGAGLTSSNSKIMLGTVMGLIVLLLRKKKSKEKIKTISISKEKMIPKLYKWKTDDNDVFLTGTQCMPRNPSLYERDIFLARWIPGTDREKWNLRMLMLIR